MSSRNLTNENNVCCHQDSAADFEQLQRLASAAGLVLLLRYFDGTCDCKAAAAQIKVGQMF